MVPLAQDVCYEIFNGKQEGLLCLGCKSVYEGHLIVAVQEVEDIYLASER